MGLLDRVLITMKDFTAEDPAIRRAIKSLEANKEKHLLRQIKIFISKSTYEALVAKGYLKQRRSDRRKA